MKHVEELISNTSEDQTKHTWVQNDTMGMLQHNAFMNNITLQWRFKNSKTWTS